MTDEASPPAPKDPAPAGPEAPAPAAERGTEGPYRAAPAAAPKPWRPNYVFLAVVSILTLAADLGSKGWASARLAYGGRHLEVIHDSFGFMLAENRGGAWGLLQDEPESIRRPFFLCISVVAVVFIVSLYRKLTPQQLALKWGLPLVLGGALGNLVNRIQLNYVVDFIDFQAGWVGKLNGLFSRHASDHWPTFNIADVAIVVGVGLMAVDMFTSRRPATPGPAAPGPAPPDAPFTPDAPATSPAETAPKET